MLNSASRGFEEITLPGRRTCGISWRSMHWIAIWHEEWFQTRCRDRRLASAGGVVSLRSGLGADIRVRNAKDPGEEGRDRGSGKDRNLWLVCTWITEGHIPILDTGWVARNNVLRAGSLGQLPSRRLLHASGLQPPVVQPVVIKALAP